MPYPPIPSHLFYPPLPQPETTCRPGKDEARPDETRPDEPNAGGPRKKKNTWTELAPSRYAHASPRGGMCLTPAAKPLTPHLRRWNAIKLVKSKHTYKPGNNNQHPTRFHAECRNAESATALYNRTSPPSPHPIPSPTWHTHTHTPIYDSTPVDHPSAAVSFLTDRSGSGAARPNRERFETSLPTH